MKDTSNIRYRSVALIAGWLLLLESVLMLAPLVLTMVLGEVDVRAFAISFAASALVGGSAVFAFRGEETRINKREGYLLISSIWVLFSLFGMLPFILSATPLSVSDAFFETMSGFTTTGATVISDVEAQSHGILLWRSMTQWLGGLGIVLFLIAIMPALNSSGGISLFNAEITGITHDKLHPQIRRTAASLWGVYLVLTLAMIPLLMFGGMDVFDSICHAMTTLSTGGYSTRNASIAAWGSEYIASVVSVFMLLGGVNFVLLYNAAHGRVRPLLRNQVVRAYLMLVAVSVLLLSYSSMLAGDGWLLAPLFHVASAVTSTGFGYGNYSAWGSLALMVTLVLMVSGACAGSTTGGIKIDRFVVLFKNLRNEIVSTLFPKHIQRVSMGGNVLEQSTLVRLMAFITIYVIGVLAGGLMMSAFGYNFTDSLFASASCMGNSGLGYGATGAGFGALPDGLKWLFSFEMLIGRLEIFTVLVLFYKPFWRR